MSIKHIKTSNVMVFQRQWRKVDTKCNDEENQEKNEFSTAFQLDFSDGINVLIGENGVGKTTILKMIYAATQWSIPQVEQGKTERLLKFFSGNATTNDVMKNNKQGKDTDSYFEVSNGEHKFTMSLSHNGILDYDQWENLNIQSVFIPTTEMLSHSKGLLALDKKFKLPFDGTQIDIIVNASLPEAREISASMLGILEKISQVIDGEVVMENDMFYVQKKDGTKVEFSLEAEGLRKLGLLWKLIRNGLLEDGTVLLWDEPESNINAELYPLVVEILLELEKNGVQIFVATHSYNLAKYFEIRRSYKEQVMFHNMYKANEEEQTELKDFMKDNKGIQVYGTSAYYMSELENNHIIMADEKLLDEALEKNFPD